MMLHIALVSEILATIICIYCIYGRKVEFDVKTVGIILGILTILEVANSFQWGGILSLSGHVILVIYCKNKFDSPMINSIISVILCIIILTTVQFICMFIANIIVFDAVYMRNVVCNILVLIFFILIFPTRGLHSLQRGICSNSKFVFILLGFMGLIITIILLQSKIIYMVKMEYFVFVIPAIIMLLYLVVKWYVVQIQSKKLEDVIHDLNEDKKEYESLFIKVRLRQHELKNHIAAIFSAHYTHKTYEKLVQAQEIYCKQMLRENKYNNLLMVGDRILAGYLYRKFQEVEDDGIELNYKVTSIEKVQVPIYYIIEMLGILFDNAVEALKSYTEKQISFEINECKEKYEFLIGNPFPYISYKEIEEWFRFERSEKGEGRGLGLYHLKCLCEEWHCDIVCRNVEIEQNNWIEFTLKINKADDT